ncbi:MAG: hypothetical protein KAU26_08315 [Methylococcales bacterium]|nr:hypothetical protein [Methylococcales bacterium]
MKNLHLKKMLIIALLGFTGSSYATDTFTATTSTLKVPEVRVGDTTYYDVVLKLKDFEVLAVGSNPLTGVLKGNFVMQLISVVRQSGQLHVKINVTSVGKDRENRIAGFNNKARLTDDKGNVYDATSVTIPRINKTYKSKHHADNHLFDADAPVEVVITFDDIDPQATKIELLDLVFKRGEDYKIRNIPFTEFEFGS